jgi:glycosyltransferase involved in cell wall biosynthesis
MRIGVTTFGADGGKSGISQYLSGLMSAFATQKATDEFDVMGYADERSLFVPDSPRFHPVDSDTRRSTLRDVLWHQVDLPRISRNLHLDVLFLPAGNRRLPTVSPCPTVGTVHDFSSIHMRGKYDAAHLFYITKVLPGLVRRLTRVIAVSESAKKDIVAFARVPEERITVIPNAVNHAKFNPGDPDAARERLGTKWPLRGPYLLYLSRLEHPAKNHVRLLQAFDRLKSRLDIPHQLVLAGSDWDRADEIHAAAAALPSANDVVFTGFVDAADVPDLYRAADLMVFPSLLEGFGIPILEAMACGVPVACSGVSSMPEVAGDAAHFFDPCDVDSIACTLAGLLEDPAARQECRRRGLIRAGQFSWENSAARTMQVLAEAAETKQ